jgi:hypothetical protein
MRERAFSIAFAAAAVVAWCVLLYLGRGLTFWSDEWEFIGQRSLASIGSLMLPHNEHWSTLAIIAYRGLLSIVGLRTYVPYLALLLALHLLVATAVYRLLRLTSGPWIALAGGVLVLFLGSGVENLLWAFQIGFVGADAAGLWALVLITGTPGRRQYVAAALLLTAGLATAGVALFFLVFVGVELALDSRRRSGLVYLALPVGAYIIWFLIWGRLGIDTYGRPFTVDAFVRLPAFVASGLATSLGAATGLPGSASLGLLVLAVIIGAWRILRGRPVPARAVGALAALIAEYVLIGLVRGQLGDWAAAYPRYTYEAAIVVLVGVAAWIGRPALPSAPRPRRMVVIAGGLLFELLLIVNVMWLPAGRSLFLDRAGLTRGLVTVALEYGNAPGVNPNRSLTLIPSPNRVRQLVGMYGDPRRDALVEGLVPAVTTSEMDRALAELADPSLVRSAAPPSSYGTPPPVISVAGAAIGTAPACDAIDAGAGGATVDLAIDAAAYLRGGASGTILIGLGNALPPPASDAVSETVSAGQWYRMQLPNLRDGRPWQLGMWLHDGTSLDVCADGPP